MKKITALIICVCLMLMLFAGCGETVADDGRLNVVTTIFPVYDWVRNIVGNTADTEITMLLDSGVDLHSFQPTADDIIKISTCDVFIYVGGESDKWVDDALKDVSKDLKIINLMDVIGDNAREEEEKEGMQSEDDEEEEEGPEYDEHIWLSVKNAAVCCEAIKKALCEADSDNSAAYEKNAEDYIGKLNGLDKQYEEAAAAATVKTLVFADRFPFAYMFGDYGLDYYAAFKGCSAETEASFETVIFLADKVDELGLKNILSIESSDGSIARTVKENTKTKDQNIVKMNSLQSITAKEVESGADYLKIMTENLKTLKSVIN